ncbi:hypothetical protein PR048_023444 [Dryococelus australis]|uniref:Tesmin/TSO1-like CXC domain-containing protein n=1 Tax=Dryococelus australis TaxID=614101 RepID=A0ABQ9GU71_9NEOP|nr:hypothetical protein PR048_023444 [Dryococelus australis]
MPYTKKGGVKYRLKLEVLEIVDDQVCRPRSLISPIILAIGVHLHREFASREIVDELYKFGFSVSYDEVQRFVKSSVGNEDQTVTLLPGHFCQWVGDNIDHNIATINGHNTFHGMGIIMCSTGSSKDIFLGHNKPIIRSNALKASEEVEKAHIPYCFCSKDASALKKIVFKQPECTPLCVYPIDILWNISKLLKEPRMEAQRLNVDVPVVTFDQCIYMKATEVVNSKPDEFPCVKFFKKCVLRTLYLIMSGKEYSCSLRGHHLIHASLQVLLIADILEYNPHTEVECIPDTDCMDVTEESQQKVSDLIELFYELFQTTMSMNDAIKSTALNEVIESLEKQKLELSKDIRTAKLWILYLKIFDVAKAFIWSEKTGNFEMHLNTVENMLPFFASSGHNNYVKYARVYIQDMREIEKKYPQVHEMFTKGYFTSRRHDRMWAGVWTEMFIEQTLMKSTKGQSGITHGGGMTESKRASLVLSHSTCSAVTMCYGNPFTYKEYELCTFPPALFNLEKQCIRKSDESALARHLDGVISDNTSNIHCDTYHVVDGGTPLQLVVWPLAKVTVVFDDYTTSSIKDMEQSRRMKHSLVTYISKAIHHLPATNRKCCEVPPPSCTLPVHDLDDITRECNRSNKFGWENVDGELLPISKDIEPAPDTLLNVIQCACKMSICDPCSRNCKCKRYGLPCSEKCKNCMGKICTNINEPYEEADQDL